MTTSPAPPPIAADDELAVYLPKGRITPPVNPYGRLIANAGVFRALARSGDYRRMTFLCHAGTDPVALADELQVASASPVIATASPLSTVAATRCGTLLYGQPYLSEPAWARRHGGHDADYSIVGTIFAFASPAHREQMLQSTLAPLHEWDALVCSSPTLALTVARTLDNWEEHLRERLGQQVRLPRPQLPVIPFGVDAGLLAAQGSDETARSAMRASLGADADDVVVLFLGRLSYYDKAFPQAMLKAVEAAQHLSGKRLHFVMTGWFPGEAGDRARFEEAALAYAPSVSTVFLDGNDPEVVAAGWAAADVFLLLSDTILETFGQALVEAMAAGLPLVVSDWDGYRSIVRDGIDGFRIPTLGAPPGVLGQALAMLQSADEVGYAQYAGTVSQHTAVHVGRAAAALAELASSPELRRSMGAAGQRRARELFDWPVVVRQYRDLFAELQEQRLRASGSEAAAAAAYRLNPLRGDPFDDFRELPSQVASDATIVTAIGSLGSLVELDRMFPGLRGDEQDARAILDLLTAQGPMAIGDLFQHFDSGRRAHVRMTVLWLAKAGMVDWLP